MKKFDGNWNFDPSKYVVCNRHYDQPLILATRKEWAEWNKVCRRNDVPEWIETVKR